VAWWRALVGGAIGFTFFTLAAVVGNVVFGPGTLGGGDIKLAAFVGLVTGFPLVIEAIVLAILIGGAVSLVLLITRVRSLTDYIPYGPFLIAGAMITLLWGHSIADWFLP
jgi:prepilin signal peptidase PulO-like enzyme (type II secretory pathway)